MVFQKMVFVIFVVVLMAALFPNGSDAVQGSQGSTWCQCVGDGGACKTAMLRFRPEDGSPSASWVQMTNTAENIPVVAGRRLPDFHLQLVTDEAVKAAGGSANAVPTLVTKIVRPISVLDMLSTLNATIARPTLEAQLVSFITFKDSTTREDVLPLTTIPAESGEYRVSNLILTQPPTPVNASGTIPTKYSLRFVLSVPGGDVWISTPSIVFDTIPYRLVFPRLYSHFTSTMSLVQTHVVIDKPLPDVIIQYEGNLGEIFPLTIDGRSPPVTVRAIPAVGPPITVTHDPALLVVGVATISNLRIGADTIPNTAFTFEFSVQNQIPLVSAELRALRVEVPAFSLRFAPREESFITSTNSDITAIVGSPLPTVSVWLQDSAFQRDLTTTGDFVYVEAHGAVLAPTSTRAVLRGGRAVFEDLTFESLPFDPVERSVILTFSAGSSVEAAGKPLYSPPITIKRTSSGTAPVGLRFRADSSFLRYEGATLRVTRGMPIPPIVLEAYTDANTVAASMDGKQIQISATPDAGIEGTQVVTMMGSTARFDNLSVTMNQFVNSMTFTFFIPGNRLPGDPIIDPIKSGAVLVTSTPVEAVTMRFAQSPMSVFSSEYTDNFGTRGVPLPPIVIDIVQSDGSLDLRANEVVVSADTSLSVENGAAVATGGRVVFDRLTFGEAGVSTLRFTAVSQAGHPVHGQVLTAGFIGIQDSATPRFGIKFARNSFITHPGIPLSVATDVVLPRVVVFVTDSSHVLDMTATINVNIEVEITGGSLAATSQTTAIIDNTTGEAVFDGIRLEGGSANGSATENGAQLHFRAVFTMGADSNTAVRTSSPAIGSILSTGPITLVSPNEPIMLAVVSPYEGGPAANESGVIANASISITDPDDVKYFVDSETNYQISLQLRNAQGRTTLPPTVEDIEVSVNSSAEINATGTPFPVYSSFPSSTTASFQQLQFNPEANVDGFFHMLTFKSAWGPMIQRPFLVGPMFSLKVQSDSDLPVVVVEVLSASPEFDIDRWIESLAELLNIEKSRIELVRLRKGGSATSDFEFEWIGTRVEMRFLNPTTSSSDKASSSELASLFIGLEESELLRRLKIRRKLYRLDDKECDLYRLDEQLESARRCMASSTADERCGCYKPLFQAIGTDCKTSGPVMGACSQLRRCTDPVIKDPCFSFEARVYLQYLFIAGCTFGAGLLVYMGWAYKTGKFHRLCRFRLGGGDSKKHESAKLTVEEEGKTDHFDVIL